MGVNSGRRSGSQVLGEAPAVEPAVSREQGEEPSGKEAGSGQTCEPGPPPDAGGCQVTRSRALSRKE